MGARRKGRCAITYAGRRYLWYVQDEWYLRIASEDKRFAVAYQWPGDPGASMLVSGSEFPGIAETEKRPVRLVPPRFKHHGLKTLVRKIIRWSLSEEHEIRRMEAAQLPVADAGFPSVDAYIADIVVNGASDETDNLDHLFTAERLAHIDQAEADIKAGKSYTAEQADEELAKRRAKWIRTNPH